MKLLNYDNNKMYLFYNCYMYFLMIFLYILFTIILLPCRVIYFIKNKIPEYDI